MIFFKWQGASNLIFLKRVFFCEFSDVTHTHIAAILKIFCSVKIMYFFIKMYYVSVKCLIFTLIINFYLFFGQDTDGKELTIDKDNISKVRFFQILLHNSIIFYKVSVKIRYACVTSQNSQKNTLFKEIKFDPRAIKKKSS
jgi:hypothetical protein